MSADEFVLDRQAEALFVDLDLPASDVLRRAGLPLDLFARGSVSLSVEEYFGLWEAIDATAADPALPVRIAESLSAEVFSVPIFAALCARDLNAATARIRTFKPLVGPVDLVIDVTDSFTEISIDWSRTGEPPLVLATVELLFWTSLARMATRHRVPPLAVTGPGFAAPQECTAYLGIEPTVGSRHSVRFSAEDAARPFLTVNDAMWATFEPSLRRRLSDLQRSSTMTKRVKAALLELLPSGT